MNSVMPFASMKNLLNGYYSDQYGSVRGFLRTKKYLILYYMGRYKKYQNIKWQDVKRLVFVCKGNICRSAYAEAVANSLSMEAVSFGIDTVDDMPAYDDAIYCAEKKGVNLNNHRTLSFASFEYKPGDLFVAMDPSHLYFLERSNAHHFPMTLAGLWCATARPHIEDPYGKSQGYFANCFDCIEKSVYAMKEKIHQSTKS
jgi:protein-tyrosine phosphatase